MRLVARLVAVAALAAAILGVGSAVAPVRNGQIQDCGTPAAFLLNGRADAAPPTTPDTLAPTDEAQPCSHRAKQRIGLGFGLLGGGAVLVIVWAVVADNADRRVPSSN